jgi:hypothetical protein
MDYRFVVLNSSGQAARAEDWSCPSDVEAVDRARQHAAPYGAELWRGDRQLSVVPPRLTPEPA